jgi:hypothetical protein
MEPFLFFKKEDNLENLITTIPTPLNSECISFQTLFVYVKMRELFKVAKLGGTLCIVYRYTGLHMNRF